MSDDRPVAYMETREVDGDVLIIRASGFGSCERAIIAVGTGLEPAPPPGWLQEKFDEGHEAEFEILQALSSKPGQVKWRDGKEVCRIAFNHLNPLMATSYRKLGENISRHPEDAQFLVEWPIWPGVLIRGHTDSIGSVYVTADDRFGLGDLAVIEAKKFGDALWKKWVNSGVASMEHYAWQVSLYMHSTGLPAIFLVGHRVDVTDPDEARELGRDWKIEEVRAELVTRAPIPLADMLKKARSIHVGVTSGVVPETCPETDFPCPVFYLHADKEEEGVVDLTGALEAEQEALRDELEDLGRRYHLAAQNEKQAKATKRDLGARMMELVRQAGGDESAAITPSFRVRHVHSTWAAYEVKAGSSDYVKVTERKGIES